MLQKLLSDPNFQTVVVPLFTVLIPVVLGWVVGQVAADQKKAKWGRWLKLVVETAVLGFIGRVFPEAMAAFSSDNPTAKVIGLLYSVVLVGLLGMMVVDVVQLVRKPSILTASELDEARWQDNRQILMDKVGVKWIDGVLKNSLYEQARIAVGLEERPEMVGMEWQRAGEEKQVLPPGTRLLDRFANLGGGGTLLVLGEPGAGKTTLLLELAQDLLEATDFQELKQPIPIVLNLSAWGTQQFPNDGTLAFTQWLLEELWQQYQVRKEVGKTWLEQEKWTLLLDGLDEVKPQDRDACVEALNQFRQKFGNIEIALCCRIVDYQALITRLEEFQAAVYIQPLSEKQVDDYLQEGGEALVGIATALGADPSLRDLVNKPLFLWILTLAYRNRPAQELLDLPKDQRLKLLFDRYIERMFAQRSLPEPEQQQMLHWLQGIAKKTGAGKEFLIERMKPKDWLETARTKWLFGLILGLIFGLIFGLICGLFGGIVGELFGGIVGGLFGGLMGLYGGLYVGMDLVEAERTKWLYRLLYGLAWGLILGLIFGLIGRVFGLIGGLISGLIFGLIGLIFGLSVRRDKMYSVKAIENPMPRKTGRRSWKLLESYLTYALSFGGLFMQSYGLIGGLILGLIFGLILGESIKLIGGLSIKLIGGLKVDILDRTFPNQVIWGSLKTIVIQVIVSLVFMIVLCFTLVNILPLFLEPFVVRFIIALFMVLPLFLILNNEGIDPCTQHLSMRLVLCQTKQIPWNFVTFFQQAEDCVFIYRTGGSYVFVHRYLQEHFANLSFDET